MSYANLTNGQLESKIRNHVQGLQGLLLEAKTRVCAEAGNGAGSQAEEAAGLLGEAIGMAYQCEGKAIRAGRLVASDFTIGFGSS